MSVTRAVAISLSLALTACSGGESGHLTANSTPGWPADRYLQSAHGVVPAAVSLAWRTDTTDGPETRIWISGVVLDSGLRETLRTSLGGQSARASPGPGVPGLLLSVRDDGTAAPRPFTVCAAADGAIQCSQSEIGKVVVAYLDANRVQGAFFSDSRDRKTRYAATFDAPIANASAVPFPVTTKWSSDGGAPGAAFLQLMEAATTKDTATLKSLTVQERSGDWDHFGVISSMQRTARQQQRVIAGVQQGDAAHVWVLPTATGADPRLPAQVEMRKVDGSWRFVRMVF